LAVAPDELEVLQRLLQQSLLCVQGAPGFWPPGFGHDVPPELPPGGGLPVTVIVTHSDLHEAITHFAYWSKALMPLGYCESQPQLGDELDDELPLHELAHCAYVRQSEL
jgi:hypothetical protein